METVIVLLGLLLPVLAASTFYLGDHREARRAHRDDTHQR